MNLTSEWGTPENLRFIRFYKPFSLRMRTFKGKRIHKKISLEIPLFDDIQLKKTDYRLWIIGNENYGEIQQRNYAGNFVYRPSQEIEK